MKPNSRDSSTTYAGDATPYQRKLFADSLRAALTLEEMRFARLPGLRLRDPRRFA